MSVNCRFETWSWPRRARMATALLLSVLTVPLGIAAQAPSQFLIMPGCYVPPPPPANDGFPIAVTDSLQTVAAPLVFTGATLLANDTGAAPISRRRRHDHRRWPVHIYAGGRIHRQRQLQLSDPQ